MTLVLSPAEVRRLLPMPACIDRMEQALTAHARAEVVNPLRWALRLPERGRILGMMPGATTEPATVGLKVIAVYPDNLGTEWDAHQGVVVLFDPEHGFPLLILDASEVTAIRTAAVSGVATRALAREDASDLALLGSGIQAWTHLEAMAAVRALQRVRVWSPTAASRAAFVERAGDRYPFAVEAVASAPAAVEGADIVCTVTSARTPVLEGSWLADGAHVNAAGACVPSARELDAEAVRRARVFVDSRESADNEAGDLLVPVRTGELDAVEIVGELGEVLAGTVPGRTDARQITLFESLGIAVEDLVAAHHVLERARAEGVGTTVDLGGRRL